MDAETDYVEYVTSFSLSILAASAIYFLDISSPVTYLSLVMIPLLYGYTAYISRDGFRKSSLLSAIALFFIPLNSVMAITGMLITFGNPLVSAFSGGSRFHDYFRSVSLPLLVTGVLIGTSGFLLLNSQPETKQRVTDQISESIGQQMAQLAETTNIIANYRRMQQNLIRETSEASIATTQAYVTNRTSENLSVVQQKNLVGAFKSARQDVPERMIKNLNRSKEKNAVAEPTEKAFKNILQRPNAEIIFVPAATIMIYSLNPIIGILTGLFALLFQSVDRRYAIFGTALK